MTPWAAARQASLSNTKSRSLPKLMSIASVMPPYHLILCHPLLLLPSVFPSIPASLARTPYQLESSHIITRMAGKCRLAQCLGQRTFGEQSLPHPTFLDIKGLFPMSHTHTVDILYPRDIINLGWSGNWNLSRIYKRINYWIQGNIWSILFFFKELEDKCQK